MYAIKISTYLVFNISNYNLYGVMELQLDLANMTQNVRLGIK